ncbi:MAG: leucine-rich repeat protein [Clostridia bacterium]|nr:leucine-rich repeat protein [Clostridia bacterium]
MDSVFYQCSYCGGELKDVSPSECQCMYCGKKFKKQSADEYEDRIRKLLGEDKAEKVAALRRTLWDEIHSERPDGGIIAENAKQLKASIPDDWFALFCEAASYGGRRLNDFLTSSDAKSSAEYADAALPFLFRTMHADNINAVGLYIQRLIDTDPKTFGIYSDDYEKVCEKLKSGLYEIRIPRDVFLAYSGADAAEVIELCDYLEAHDISCFFAMRNLRHGARAADDYKKALEYAADNCKVIVFVSSVNSRSLSCEALTYELPYVKAKDLESAPAVYRHAYERLPLEYKMPRVEYLLDSYTGDVAETISKEFFSGVEWCTTKEAVGKRIVKYLTAPQGKKAETAPVISPESSGDKTVSKPEVRKPDFEIHSGALLKYNGTSPSVVIPPSVTRIEARAFYNNSFVVSVAIPNSVFIIGHEAFAGCVRLTSVKMSKNLMSIDGRAFADCVSLPEIEIPLSVEDMGKGVFSGDASMRYIYIGASTKPRGWNNTWCQCKTEMVWGHR